MDLTPLKLYRILIPFKEKSDPKAFFKRICKDLINERIDILKKHGLLSFFGGETKIKKDLESQLVTPADIERENELNELVDSVLNKFEERFKSETTDFRPLIGFLDKKSFNKATFNSLEKELKSLPKTSKAYISSKLKNEPCALLTKSFKELDSYQNVPELVKYADNQSVSADVYNAVSSTSVVKRAGFINKYLVPKFHFLTKEQVDKILDEAEKDRLLKLQGIRTRSTRNGIIGFIASSLIFFLAFFFLSLLATFQGYSAFGADVLGKVGDSTNYQTALFGMVLILPTFFLATFFGAYERRWALRPYEDKLIFQIAPRFVPSVTLILHAILLFNLTKNPQGDAGNNIFYKVFYLGDKGYTLGLIYIFIAVTTLIMDLFSLPQKSELEEWNAEGLPPGRLWLTQNGSLYIFPFVFFLRLFMPSISLGIMIALTILTSIFGLFAPVILFILQLRDREDGDPYCDIDPSTFGRGLIAAAIFMAIMFFTYLMMTFVHANPDWFKGKWSFFTNLGWFVLLLIIIAGCLFGLAQLTGLDSDYLDISPTFYFFILGFVLLFFIIPEGSETSPNIYYQGWATGPVVTFIILLMIVSSIHDVCCLISSETDIDGGDSATRISNLGFIIAAVTLYILSGAMHLFPIYVLAIFTPVLTALYYIFAWSGNDNLSLLEI